MAKGLLRGYGNPATITGSGTKREGVFEDQRPNGYNGYGPQAPVFFSNIHSVAAYVRINEDLDAAIEPGGYHVIVPAGTTRELTEGGRVPISRVNAIWASDPGTVGISGWNWPGGNKYEWDAEDNAAIGPEPLVRGEPVFWEASTAIVAGAAAGVYSGPGWSEGSGTKLNRTGQFCNLVEFTNDYDEPAYVKLNAIASVAGVGPCTQWDAVGDHGHDWIVPAGTTVELCAGLLMVRALSVWLPAGATGDVNVVGYAAGRWRRHGL